MERTLVIIKPDGVERNLVGEIINYYEKGGLKITALKMTTVSKDLIEKHYPEDEEYMTIIGKKAEKAGDKVDDYVEFGRMVVKSLRNYLSRGPVVPMILEGENAIKKTREITGYTDPTTADKGTLRAELGTDSILKSNQENRATENLVHASGNPEEAEAEIKLWFGEN